MSNKIMNFAMMLVSIVVVICLAKILSEGVNQKIFSLFLLSCIYMFVRIRVYYSKTDDGTLNLFSFFLIPSVIVVLLDSEIASFIIFVCFIVVLFIRGVVTIRKVEEQAEESMKRIKYYNPLFLWFVFLQTLVLISAGFKPWDIAGFLPVQYFILMCICLILLKNKGVRWLEKKPLNLLVIAGFLIVFESAYYLAFGKPDLITWQWVLFAYVYALFFNIKLYIKLNQQQAIYKKDVIFLSVSFVAVVAVALAYVFIRI